MMNHARSPEEELDLALAAELQAALLPKKCPTDCRNHVAAARNRMCARVGGDFHDFVRINEDQTAILIGDVAGHGVRASLVMARIMGWLRGEPQARSRPLHVVADLNRMLIDLGEKTGTVTPCSIIYLVLDSPTGIAFIVNAGHPRPLLCDRDKCSALALGARNMILGVQEFQPEETCHTFLPGERLVLYTDGITDAVNGRGEHFGQQRLHKLASEYARSGPQQVADAVFAAVDLFCGNSRQSDDQTVVVVDRV